MIPRPEATRVAALTPGGRGAVGTLVVVGPDAERQVSSRFEPARRTPHFEFRLRTPHFGRWRLPGGLCEEVVVCRLAEDRFEIHGHGGPVVVAALVASLTLEGAVERSWAAWTIDEAPDSLVAEARLALARCRTRRAAQILLDQAEGALTQAVERILERLDAGRREEAEERTEALLATAEFGLHLTRPWRAVMAGRPNVGKSSLANALAGFARALVSDRPGTTRDLVTAETAVDGWWVELVDTAGLRDTDDPLEAAGVVRARRAQQAADCVLLVVDRSAAWTAEDAAAAERFPGALVVENKSDLPEFPDARRPRGLRVSARTGEGIAELARGLADRLAPRPPAHGDPIVFTWRQNEGLQALRNAVREASPETAAAAVERLLRSPVVEAEQVARGDESRLLDFDS